MLDQPTHATTVRNLDTVRRAFAGIAAASAEQMLVDNYTDDMVLELPYSSPPAMMEGKPATLAALGRTFETFTMVLEITEVHEGLDPDKLVIEYTSLGTLVATGKTFTQRYIGVYWFRDGRICRVREFANPDRSFRRG